MNTDKTIQEQEPTLTLEQRVKKLELEMQWKNNQIAVLIDYVSRLLGYPKYMDLREDIEQVYERAILSIEQKSQQ